jgi:hypothetical protein
MSHEFAKLRALTLDELIEKHDAAAIHTSVGVKYYLEEIYRRDAESQARESALLARRALVTSVISAVIGAASIIVAVALAFIR